MAKLLLAALLLAATACTGAHAKFSRHSFPKDFVFGTGSAAYQYEGAYKGGKGPSIWDKFSHIPGKILNNDTGDVADDIAATPPVPASGLAVQLQRLAEGFSARGDSPEVD